MIRTKIEESTFGTSTINRIYTNILSYDLENEDCRLRYELRYKKPGSSVAEPDDIITQGVWKVPQTVLDSWTGTNHLLAEKLCEYLGYTIIKHLNIGEVE